MQSRLSNDEVIDEITSSINRNMNYGPAPIQFDTAQVITILGGPRLAAHIANIVDDFDLFTDADDTIQLSVKVGEEDETEFYVPPDLSPESRLHDYLFPIDDGPTRSIRVYKNAMTLVHDSGAHGFFMITLWAHKKAQFVPTDPDTDQPVEGAPAFDHPQHAVLWLFNNADPTKHFTIKQV